MNKLRSALFGLTALALAAGTAQAQTPRTASAPPKVAALLPQLETGVWMLSDPGCFGPYLSCYTGQEGYADKGEIPKYPLPLKPEAAAEFKHIQDELAKGVSIFDPDSQCYPAGMPSMTRAGFKLAFQTDRIYFIYGNAAYRTVYMDGRKIPQQDPVDYTFNGYSVGHWEGDTLVVETRNILGENTQIPPNVPKSDKLWIVERFTPVSADLFDYTITMKDEERFTATFTQKWQYKRNAKAEPGPQQPCVSGDGQRYVANPETGALEMTGPGGAPLEKAEP